MIHQLVCLIGDGGDRHGVASTPAQCRALVVVLEQGLGLSLSRTGTLSPQALLVGKGTHPVEKLVRTENLLGGAKRRTLCTVCDGLAQRRNRTVEPRCSKERPTVCRAPLSPAPSSVFCFRFTACHRAAPPHLSFLSGCPERLATVNRRLANQSSAAGADALALALIRIPTPSPSSSSPRSPSSSPSSSASASASNSRCVRV